MSLIFFLSIDVQGLDTENIFFTDSPLKKVLDISLIISFKRFRIADITKLTLVKKIKKISAHKHLKTVFH